jgi:hypothetical protein
MKEGNKKRERCDDEKGKRNNKQRRRNESTAQDGAGPA